MKNHWHEQIQHYVQGRASAEEIAALQTAMKDDAELRAWYLDYMNLDVALGAAAEAVTIAEHGRGSVAPTSRLPAWPTAHGWHWVAATAACVAFVMVALLLRPRGTAPASPDVAAACASTQEAIARLSVEPPASFPAWVSPTASILDQPRIPQGDL